MKISYHAWIKDMTIKALFLENIFKIHYDKFKDFKIPPVDVGKLLECPNLEKVFELLD